MPTRPRTPSRRPHGRLVLGAILCAALLVPVTVTTEASAWTPNFDNYYTDMRWPTGNPVTWSFADNYPSSGDRMRNRVIDAFLSWNALGQPLQYAGPGADVPRNGSNSCANVSPRRAVMWEPLGGQMAGWAWKCGVTTLVNGIPIASGYRNFEITLDSDNYSEGYGTVEWWRYLGDIPSSPYYRDVWSVATHEIGHVNGQSIGGVDGEGHFANSSNHTCPGSADANYLDRESLCKSLLLNSRVGRNPAWHETWLFDNAY